MGVVFGVMYCPSIYESEYRVESLHGSLRGAYYAMRALTEEKWSEFENMRQQNKRWCRKMKFMDGQSIRIERFKVEGI